jgi:hypothetical protein
MRIRKEQQQLQENLRILKKTRRFDLGLIGIMIGIQRWYEQQVGKNDNVEMTKNNK